MQSVTYLLRGAESLTHFDLAHNREVTAPDLCRFTNGYNMVLSERLIVEPVFAEGKREEHPLRLLYLVIEILE